MHPIRQANLLEVNEFLVLDHIRDRGRTTRREIERALGISRASVSRIVRRLEEAGSVTETAGSSPRGGRPSDVIEYNFQGASVIAADVGARKCHVALADLGGTILRDFVRSTFEAGSAYETLRGLVVDARAEAEEKALPVVTLVVGLPAIIDPDTNTVVTSPWDFGGSDLVRRLESDLQLPIVAENEANLAALAQAWRGLGRGLPNFAVISVGSGIGGAVVANGQLVRGRRSAAGEVGFLLPSREELRRPLTRPTPLLEEAAGAAAIARNARRYLEEAEPGSPALGDPLDAAGVFAAAERDGAPWARRAIDDALDLVALAVISVAAVVDPELVILDGGVGRSLGPYVDGIERRVHLRVAFTPAIRVSELGPDSTVIGGVAAGLEFARQQRAPMAAMRPLPAVWHTGRSSA